MKVKFTFALQILLDFYLCDLLQNYIATEGQSWDTSTAHIRRTFRACIDYGRRARGSEGADLWEAYRYVLDFPFNPLLWQNLAESPQVAWDRVAHYGRFVGAQV